MADYTCPNCGQKALPVATRCPRCGLPIETQFMQHQVAAPKKGQRWVIGVVIAVVLLLFTASRLQQPARTPSVIPPPVTQAVVLDSTALRPVAATADTTKAPQDTVPKPDSASSAAVPTRDTTDTTRPAVTAQSPAQVTPQVAPQAAAPVAPTVPPSQPAEPPLPRGAVRRYAATWINVRSGRDNQAPVIRILHPGDAVVVDSLSRGWYRIIARGESVGYIDRRLLDTIPGATRP